MSSGRRRSSRLIESPQLYNWKKKPPVYIDLGEDEIGDQSDQVVEEKKSVKRIKTGTSVKTSPSSKPVVPQSLDIRQKRKEGDSILRMDTSDEDEEFVTPLEDFRSKSKKRAAKVKSSGAGMSSLGATSAGIRGKRKINISEERLQVCSAGQMAKQSQNVDKQRQDCLGKKAAKDVSGAKNAGELSVGVRETAIEQDKVKKVRSYAGYIQKKFTPLIMTDVLINLSKAQTEWVRSTGFEHLLAFRMVTYPHRLGYKVVDAFCSRTCTLKLPAGDVAISERLVHNIIGLPNGPEVIKLKEGRIARGSWDEQYPSNLISPKMVRDKIMATRIVDNNFKMNFLILVYNFFIEANQNRYVTRDLLSFGGNIDECVKYNWCRLLIEKLKSTHEYWAENKKRIFPGPLPFLIYCYVCCVRAKDTVHVAPKFPAYQGWSDMMLRERQNTETKLGSFGMGEKLNLDCDLELHDKTGGIEMEGRYDCEGLNDYEADNEVTMRDMVVADSISTDGNAVDINNACESNVSESLKFAGKVIDVSHDNLVSENNGSRDMHIEGDKATMITDDLEFFVKEQKEDMFNKKILGVNSVEKYIVESEKGKKASSEAHVMDQSTQARLDIEIERHYEEEPYLIRFEANLQELDAVYNRCLTNFIDSLALYPQNAKLAELRRTYNQYFKMFGESSPLSKSLSNSDALAGLNGMVQQDDDESVPSYSLGLTQMFPKNLGKALDTCAETPEANVGKFKQNVDHIETDAGRIPIKIRPRRGVVPAVVCRSPYVTRIVDLSRHNLTVEERNVWDWLCQDHTNMEEHIFEWKGRACTKAHFHSLEDNKLVESTVIDTWTHMLNENEILRSVTSPLRLFLTSETTYGPMQMNVEDGDNEGRLNRYVAFDDNMEVVWKLVNEVHSKQYHINDFDMFLFPVFSEAHHYVICYNVKKPRWEIIDNRVQIMSMEDTYGDLPWRLHDRFCHFLECCSIPKYSEIVNLQPEVIKMSWQTVDNSVDCGVFVMRHLESYMGNAATWKSGLRTESENQASVLHKLRVMYAHRMLTWTENKKRHLVLNKMVKFSVGKLKGL